MQSIENIKKFNSWKNNWDNPSSLGLLNYISFNIHPDDVLILGNLFFPNFIEFDNSIFYSEHFNLNGYNEWRQKLNNDSIAIEKVINHVHVYDIFTNCTDQIDDATFKNIGKLLQLSWSMYLNKVFPDKQIIVMYSDDESEYGPTLTVHQASK